MTDTSTVEQAAFEEYRRKPYRDKLEYCPDSFLRSETGSAYSSPHVEQAFRDFRAGYLAAPKPVASPDALVERLRGLLAKATPGPWDIYPMPIQSGQEAKTELCEQVDLTSPVGPTLYLLNAGGKCPAVIGCGPTSEANATLIVEAVNALPTLLAALSSRQ
jgi:hypothetical protein